MVLSKEQIAQEVEEFADLARAMKELTTSTAGTEHKSTIIGFAAQAAGYSGKIRKAKIPEEAEQIIKEASGKRDKWLQLLELLCVAAEMEDPDSESLKEAERKVRATAEQLRKVASGGDTDVFKKIGEIATQAEEGLRAFLDAPTPQEKWNEFSKVEEARAQWVLQMANVKEEVDNRPPLEDPSQFIEAAQAAQASKRASCDYLDDTAVVALKAAAECMSVRFDKASCEAVSTQPAGIMDFKVPDYVQTSFSKSSVPSASEIPMAATNMSSAAVLV